MSKKKKTQKKLPTYLQERKKSNLFTFQKYKKDHNGPLYIYFGAVIAAPFVFKSYRLLPKWQYRESVHMPR